MSKKTTKAPHRVRFSSWKPVMVDRVAASLGLKRDSRAVYVSLQELASQALDEMSRLLNSDDPNMREIGKRRRQSFARLLANNADRMIRETGGSQVGAKTRREIGDAKKKKVLAALARSENPHVTDRHVRRIKNSQTPK